MADNNNSNGENSRSSPSISTEKMPNYSREKDADLDDDSGITMVDVLENEKELDEDANAVLGGSDDQNCTYPSGYVKRQALYACGTCLENTAGNNETLSAGICLACSFSCHEGHKLVELYTKRNFRCDCGNSKFNSNPCKLYPDKDPLNVNNNYNQNFTGVYCVCSRPYPDPDDEIEDEMIQCIICEDWYHGRHLGTAVPDNNEYGEMVCGSCMDRCEFLLAYSACNSESREDAGEGVAAASAHKSEDIDVEKVSTQGDCLWKELCEKMAKRQTGAAAFMPDGWRSKLCTCSTCREKYAEKNVMFLLDNDDTVHFYEEQGKAKNSAQSTYDQGMQALSQMDRMKQVEAISGYNDMKVELLDFLKGFADRKKVVRKEDIDEFFSQMKAKKRRVDVTIPQFCR